MRFFSAIGRWFNDVKQTSIIFRLVQANPEQLKAKYADIHAFLDKLQENQVASLHRATGAALSSWAVMEENIVLVAAILLRAKPSKVGLIFYSIINFQVWIAIITELFGQEGEFYEFSRRWNRIAERLRAEKDSRDRLAHNAVLSKDISDNPIGTAVSRVARLDTRIKSKSLAPMTLEQVISFAKRISDISDDVSKLVDDMMEHFDKIVLPSSPDKSTALNPDQSP